MIHRGGCLCGAIRFEASGPAANPHSCSCGQCQKQSGALTVCWVEFASDRVRWTGPGGEPARWRSSPSSSRAFCPACGSAIGAIDDEPVIALLLGVFDAKDRAELQPRFHSFEEGRPAWWRPHVEPPGS